MKLSFGMIFSIILIIIFIAFAFYAIGKFMSIQNNVKVTKFVNDLQSDVDKMWKGSRGSQEYTYILPSKIDKVCFVDYSSSAKGVNQELYKKLKQVFYEFENMIFYPIGSAEGFDAKEITNIDLEKTTNNENPLCFDVIGGKVKLTLEIEYGESLVTIAE